MPDIDFGLAYEFVDPADGVPRQLRFELHDGDLSTLDGTGQLVATVAHGARLDHGDTLLISRAGVTLAEVEAALDGWQTWAMVGHNYVNLAHIQRRIHAAGLD